MFNWLYISYYDLLFNFFRKIFFFKLSDLFVYYLLLYLVSYLLIFFFLKKNINMLSILLLITIATFFSYKMHITKINAGLINTLSFFHPALLLLILNLILLQSLKLFKTLFLQFSLSIIFLILGSWWSSQELLWNGWWNWDGVENSLLLFVIILFYSTHKLNFNILRINNNLVIIFFCILFFNILNKTNIFKSIHSFTNSTTALLSYVHFIIPITLFLYILSYINLVFIFYYVGLTWLLFFIFYFSNKTNPFLNINYFYAINLFYMYNITLYFSKNKIGVIFFYIIFLKSYTLFWFILPLYFVCIFKLKYNVLHIIFLNLIIVFYNFSSQLNISFFSLSNFFKKNTINYIYINDLLYGKQKLSNFTPNLIQNSIVFLYKNILIKTSLSVIEIIYSYYFLIKTFKIMWFSYNIFLFFIVTEVIYWKQKPRFKYYNKMYIFKSDLLINQQKFRRIPTKINKFHWGLKSVFDKKLQFFITSNQLTIDLRFYKLLLRKIKRKILKFKIKAYVYILPNNKTSHKSKNSRMGKGKGLNNRFYFRHKKTKPILIFLKLNKLRYLKLKKFLSKFYKYKLI